MADVTHRAELYGLEAKEMEFRFEPLAIPDVLLVHHEIIRDQRGFFLESFREAPFMKRGIPRFVQDNHARSSGKVLRGLHYQIRPAGIGKLVRCLRGRIFDVAVDIRARSSTRPPDIIPPSTIGGFAGTTPR